MMRRFILAFALLYSVAGDAMAGDGGAGFATSAGTISDHLLNAGSNWGVEWLSFCGYSSCGDGGGGLFHREDCGTTDHGLCMADGAGHKYKRVAPKGWADEYGVALGSLYDAAAHPTNPLGAANRLAEAMAGFKAAGIGLVHITPNIYMGQDFTVLPEMTLDCGWSPFSQNVDDDFRYVTEHGIIAHPSTTHFWAKQSDSAKVQNCMVLRSDGTKPPTTFFPATTRDALDLVSQFAGEGISVDDTDSFSLENVAIYGFTDCVHVENITGGSQSPRYDHVDCDGRMYIHDIGSDGSLFDVRVTSALTAGPASNSSHFRPLLTALIDNLINDGTGKYKVVARLNATDVDLDGRYLALQAGDYVDVSTDRRGILKANSANDGWIISNPTTVGIGTDGCGIATCQEFTLDHNSFGDSSNVPAVTTAATWGRGSNVLTGISLSAIAKAHVGQTITSGSCIPAGTEIDHVHGWGTTGSIWLRLAADHETLVNTTCAAVAQNVTFADVAFSSPGANDIVTINTRYRRGTAAFDFVNDAGLRVRGHAYYHTNCIHLGHDIGNIQPYGFSCGLGASTSDDSFVSLLIDGTDTDPDARRCHLYGFVLTQHYPVGVLVDSADSLGKPCELMAVGMGSGAGDRVGGSIVIKQGGLTVVGATGGRDANYVAAGAELTLSDYHGVSTSLYVEDSTATVIGCGNAGIDFMTVGGQSVDPTRACLPTNIEGPNSKHIVGDETNVLTNRDCGSYVSPFGGAETITLPILPQAGCSISAAMPSLGKLTVDTQGVPLVMPGYGNHSVGVIPMPFTNNKIGYVTWTFDGQQWNTAAQSTAWMEAAAPLSGLAGQHGDVHFGYSAGCTCFQLLPIGTGKIVVDGQVHRVQSYGETFPKASTTSNNTNYFYLTQVGAAPVTAVADNGSGKVRLTITSAPGGPVTSAQLVAACYAIPGAWYVNGIARATMIDATHVDLPDVSYDAGQPFTTATDAACRLDFIFASTTGHSADSTWLNYPNIETKTGNIAATLVGDCIIGAANAVTSCHSYFHPELDVTGTTVAGLRVCNAAATGQRDTVTDANAAFTAGIGAVVAGAGANVVPVWCDGAAWRIGALDPARIHWPANDNDIIEERRYG